MATLKNTTINDTGFLKTASGTTAQRPGSPVQGDVRWNTDLGYHEIYDGSAWKQWGQVPAFVAATGGTVTTSGDYKIHTFTSSGTFTVSDAGNDGGSNTVDYLVIAGGGGGSHGHGGGGGAGGYRESVPSPAAWTASPLANPGGGLTVNAQAYPITVGGGGSQSSETAGSISEYASPGSNSIFSSITSAGGGAFDTNPPSPTNRDGGSGSGAPTNFPNPSPQLGGSGNTPPVSPPQGNPGGVYQAGPLKGGSGGGGAGAVGGDCTSGVGGVGGNGTTSSINTSPVTRGGGGAGAPFGGAGASGGSGGGGPSAPPGVSRGTAGTANTGGGGGAGHANPNVNRNGGAGGSGLVILRYKFQ